MKRWKDIVVSTRLPRAVLGVMERVRLQALKQGILYLKDEAGIGTLDDIVARPATQVWHGVFLPRTINFELDQRLPNGLPIQCVATGMFGPIAILQLGVPLTLIGSFWRRS